jgi:hypothetical protein
VTKYLQTLALVFVFALASTALAHTQDKDKTAAPKPAAASQPPVKVLVVISRYQGEKKIGSLPYTLSTTRGRASLRMGAKVPVQTAATPILDGKAMPYGGPVQYQDVGTNIDCALSVLDGGRFSVEISVDDTSIYPDGQTAPTGGPGNPTFRSFRASDSMILKDGETGQFTTATDKVSGETVKIDVTLTVVK